MVEYLSGNRIQGSSTSSSSPPQTSWKLLARGVYDASDPDSIDTGTFTPKENMMILAHFIHSDQIKPNLRLGYSTIDASDNYAWRGSQNGGTNAPSSASDGHSQNEVTPINHQGSGTIFATGAFTNTSGKEKLGVLHYNYSGTDSAVGDRSEITFKWANTSNQVNRVEYVNGGTGSFGSGSEVVVIGCDNNESDSGTNFWQQLVDETSGSTGDFSVSFTAKKYLWVQTIGEGDGNNRTSFRMQFNGNTTSGDYKFRTQDDGKTASEGTHGDSYISIADTLGASGQSGNSGNTQVYVEQFIVNRETQYALGIHHSATNQPDTQGGSSVMDRRETVSKFRSTTPITSIKMTASGDTFPAGTRIIVWGAD